LTCIWLKSGCDVEERRRGHACGNRLTHVDIAGNHDAIDRRENVRVLQVHLSSLHVRFHLLQTRLGLRDLRFRGSALGVDLFERCHGLLVSGDSGIVVRLCGVVVVLRLKPPLTEFRLRGRVEASRCRGLPELLKDSLSNC
jgi:hypothetical protein